MGREVRAIAEVDHRELHAAAIAAWEFVGVNFDMSGIYFVSR